VVLSEQLKTFYSGKTILITGASGYIGWNIARALAPFDCRVLRLTSDISKLEKVKPIARIENAEVEYQNQSHWDKLISDVDIVFHLAAQTSVYEAEKDPAGDFEANVLPMQCLLEASRRKRKNPVIVFSGTSTQCGLPAQIPVDEKIPDKPITFYDFHKLIAEQHLKYYSQQGWVTGVSFRLTNVYGPGPKSSSADRGILNLMIRKALQGESLTIYGTGENIRDYIYIDDVVSAFLKAPLMIQSMNGNHYVLGSGQGTSIGDAINLVAELVFNHTGNRVRVKRVAPPKNLLPIEYRDFVADTNVFKILGTEVNSLKKGIKRTIGFIETNRHQF